MRSKVSRTALQQGLTQRSVALSIPKSISSSFRKSVMKWYTLSGEGWTIDRIKAIKLDIIRRKAGLQPVSSWISRTRSGNLRSGVGPLESWMLRKESNFSRGLQLLQFYTLFYAPRLLDAQKSKFLAGVLSDPPEPEDMILAESCLHKAWQIMDEPWFGRIGKPAPLELFLPSPCKRAPLPDSSVPEIEGVIDSIRYLYDTFEGLKHLDRYYNSHYKFLLENIEPLLFNGFGQFMSPLGYPVPLHTHGSFLAGRIGLIQEPGHKLRAVANPGRVFQSVLKPFGDVIYNYLHSLPWDCTHDQSKGYSVLQNHLSQGKMVYSIDLTGATDYFPLHLQEKLLLKMFRKQDVHLFSELSKSSWYFPDMGEISWLRGQPLGLFPSFGAFALTHGFLLLGLLGKPFNNEFYVLGDDVVILDDRLARDYTQMLNTLGCPISTSKSISSNLLCEFGGKIVTKSKVIPQLKWRDVSDDSFLDIAKLIGPRSIRLFKPRQIRVIKELAIVPEFLGGLGWNPKGLPLELRCQRSWIFANKKPVDHLMGYSNEIISILMNSDLFKRVTMPSCIVEKTTLPMLSTDLDQRSSRLVRFLMGKPFSNFPVEILGKNVDLVSLSLYGKHADLPINPGEGKSLRPSLLDSWEAKLRHL